MSCLCYLGKSMESISDRGVTFELRLQVNNEKLSVNNLENYRQRAEQVKRASGPVVSGVYKE